MKTNLVPLIESSLRTVGRFAAAGFEPARGVVSQLRWCWLRLNGLAFDPPPAPLSMSWIVEQQFEKYGSDPVLVARLREIEEGINSLALAQAA
jgi:hypothetical protein